MPGGLWRLVDANIETQVTLQAQSLGGFFIRHTKKEVDKAHTTLYNSRASKERRRRHAELPS
jgi:hypothetical protein